MTDYKVGQTLWYVPAYRHGHAYEVKVTKVGTKWATLDNRTRVEIGNRCVDGGSHNSPGKVYESREVYEDECKLGKHWSEFKRQVDRMYSMPDEMTHERIDEVCKLLGIVIE